jgi:hypothetical protein
VATTKKKTIKKSSKRAATTNKKAQELGTEKLASSGLTLADAKQLKISCISATQTSRLNSAFKSVCSLKLEYLDHLGEPLRDWPEAPPFYRLRYLETPTDFTEIAKKRPIRYVQPPDTAPAAYYPQNFDDWPELVADPDWPLIITEGELKAAKACKEGFPTIGLGGVYGWRAVKKGLSWLPSLEPIEWKKRNVYLCFDSDYRTNPMVCAALRDFAVALERRGAFVHLVTLPNLPGLDKVGLDDFLVHAGPSANEIFQELLTEAEPLGLTAPLWALNEHYTYVRKPGLIVDLEDMSNKVSPGAFKEHLEATKQYQERQIQKDGMVSYKAVSAAGAWLKWPLRLEALRITYAPGREQFVQPGPLLNAWPGWAVKPKRGSVKPWLDLIDHIFTRAEPEAKQWFMRWCAYPFQHPGTKLFSSVVIHGVRQGTGKSLIGYTLGKIYGDNFTEINQLDLHNQFNEWAENRQFALGDDVTGSNKRQDADFLKKIITQEKLRINAKFIPTYEVPDCLNYFFTSQHPDSFFLEDDDRRFFIHEVLVGPLPDEFYKEYKEWLQGEGPAALFYYLLNLDLGSFNPAAHAYRTAAKERMINTGRSDLASWVRTLMATPDQVLRVGSIVINKALLTSKELLLYYDPDGHTGTTANGIARELSRAGVQQVCEGKPIRLEDGSQARYFAIRDSLYWSEATMKQVVKYLNEYQAEQVVKQTKKY